MTTFVRSFVAVLLFVAATARAADNPFIGRWALTLPDGRAGWLGVEEAGGKLKASLLWGGGSVLPVEEVSVSGDTLTVMHGKQKITATRQGDELKLTLAAAPAGKAKDKAKGKKAPEAGGTFTGKLIPPLPPAPDLKKVVFAEPQQLIRGDSLTGWTLVNPESPNGWTVKDGVLSNRIQHEGGKRFANLRTKDEYTDFRLTADIRTLEGSNSGIYLRGVYEIQVAESYGKPLDPHNMGALYSRITPSVAAEKPIGQWQTIDITLVDRHVTVILNGKTIIDNQPALGCTGGALTSDESKPGPLMLQGDHTDIDYRNIVIYPVKKQS